MTMTTTRGSRPLPDVGTYLTDGERLVEVIYKSDTGVRVEDSAKPEQVFAIPRLNLGRWRKVEAAAE